MDSNFQYASTVRWHRATDLPLPPTVKRRSAGRPPPMATPRSEAQRGSVRLAAAMRSTHREMRCSAAVPLPTAKSLPLAPAGTASNLAWSGEKTATLYRVTAPADPVLVHGNRLGGAKGPQPVPLQSDAPPCGPPP
jgi:hypothetical protein